MPTSHTLAHASLSRTTHVLSPGSLSKVVDVRESTHQQLLGPCLHCVLRGGGGGGKGEGVNASPSEQAAWLLPGTVGGREASSQVQTVQPGGSRCQGSVSERRKGCLIGAYHTSTLFNAHHE